MLYRIVRFIIVNFPKHEFDEPGRGRTLVHGGITLRSPRHFTLDADELYLFGVKLSPPKYRSPIWNKRTLKPIFDKIYRWANKYQHDHFDWDMKYDVLDIPNNRFIATAISCDHLDDREIFVGWQFKLPKAYYGFGEYMTHFRVGVKLRQGDDT